MQGYKVKEKTAIVPLVSKLSGHPVYSQTGLGQKPPNKEKYKLFIYWYLCTHFGLIVPLCKG
jgi:hypothetical protein